jgi:O-antigen ligase
LERLLSPQAEGSTQLPVPGLAPLQRRTRALAAPPPKVRLDPVRLAVFGLMLITIGRMHQHFSVIAAVRPAMLLVALLVGWALLNPATLGARRMLQPWPSRAVLALFALTWVSVPFGISPGNSAMFILDVYSRVFIFWLFLSLATGSIPEYRFFIWGYLGGNAFLIYLPLFVYERAQMGANVRMTGDDMYMYDANDVGVIMCIAIPLAILMFQTSKLVGKIAAGTLLIGLVWTMALAGSRGGFLGVLGLGAALLVLANSVPLARRIAAIVVIGGTLAFAAPAGYWEQMGTILEAEADYNTTSQAGRVQIWKRGLGYFVEYPILGVGIRNFGRAEGTMSHMARNFIPGETQLGYLSPHNSFLQAAVETGIGGLLLVSGLVFGGVFGLLGLRRRMPVNWQQGTHDDRLLYYSATYLPVAWVGFGITAFFVTFAWEAPILILAAFTSATYVFAAEKGLRAGAHDARVAAQTAARARYTRVVYGADVGAAPAVRPLGSDHLIG